MFGHRFFGARHFGPRYWGPGTAVAPDEPTGRSRRRKKKLYNVYFDELPIGIESPEELIELATLSEDIPLIKLSKKVDYGPMIEELKAAINKINVMREEAEDDEIIQIFLLH